MDFYSFQKNFKDFVVFSLHDIRISDSRFDNRRLVEWQKKGYIRKILRGYYYFSDTALNESVLFLIANRIYSPSYISLEMALSYYGLIPEATYQITSVTSRTNRSFSTANGNFSYRHIQPRLMTGYRLIPYQNQVLRIADPEKALLDYLYWNPSADRKDDIDALRLNTSALKDTIDPDKLHRYLEIYQSKKLEKRINLLDRG